MILKRARAFGDQRLLNSQTGILYPNLATLNTTSSSKCFCGLCMWCRRCGHSLELLCIWACVFQCGTRFSNLVACWPVLWSLRFPCVGFLCFWRLLYLYVASVWFNTLALCLVVDNLLEPVKYWVELNTVFGHMHAKLLLVAPLVNQTLSLFSECLCQISYCC